MAASIGIHTGARLSIPSGYVSGDSTFSAKSNLSICSRIKPPQGLSASAASAAVSPPIEKGDSRGGASPEKIDAWMRESVADIVKNLKQAPLLVQIYAMKDGEVRIQTEKANVERWPEVKIQWETGESKPDGLILVDELEEEENGDGNGDGEGVTRAWGVVVQGKGVGLGGEYGPACYLLKTNRVLGGMGLGFCTHFCLMKVNNFRDTALQQLRDSWLLATDH
ncbi:uncharacterized protein LOC127256319 [Andrographis paniculata]|uniref:uncharacterized protein LOC127256319 n=1 Tax=Andrographis paniculata TaxID=175694 RepID=UPI0021E8EF06|nr:uncharacterized protein LOC127256319 [Andrographis paniculata]